MGEYSVKAVSTLLGLSPHTLRAWERRYRAIEPSRLENGRRRYSQEELERLRLLTFLVSRGHAISAVAKLPDERLRALAAYDDSGDGGSPFGQAGGERESLRPLVEGLLEAVSAFSLSELAAQLEWARAAFRCRTFVLEIVVPLMSEVGRRVAGGELDIAQEHALSAILRDQVGQVLRYFDSHRRRHGDGASGPRFLLTTPEGNHHELGILLAAILLADHGLRAHYLGANLPAEALVFAADALRPDVVLLGTTALPPETPHVPLAAYVGALHAKLPPGREIWIGGAVLLRPSEIPRGRAVTQLESLAALDARLRALSKKSTPV